MMVGAKIKTNPGLKDDEKGCLREITSTRNVYKFGEKRRYLLISKSSVSYCKNM